MDKHFEAQRDGTCRTTEIVSPSGSHYEPNVLTVWDGHWDAFVEFVNVLDEKRRKKANGSV